MSNQINVLRAVGALARSLGHGWASLASPCMIPGIKINADDAFWLTDWAVHVSREMHAIDAVRPKGYPSLGIYPMAYIQGRPTTLSWDTGGGTYWSVDTDGVIQLRITSSMVGDLRVTVRDGHLLTGCNFGANLHVGHVARMMTLVSSLDEIYPDIKAQFWDDLPRLFGRPEGRGLRTMLFCLLNGISQNGWDAPAMPLKAKDNLRISLDRARTSRIGDSLNLICDMAAKDVYSESERREIPAYNQALDAMTALRRGNIERTEEIVKEISADGDPVLQRGIEDALEDIAQERAWRKMSAEMVAAHLVEVSEP